MSKAETQTERNRTDTDV